MFSVNILILFCLIWAPKGLASIQFYESLNKQFAKTVTIHGETGKGIIYGHPKIGFFEPKHVKVKGNSYQITYMPVSYKYPTLFLEKKRRGHYGKVFEAINKSPLPSAFNLIKIKTKGQFTDPFFLVSGALPRSRFKDFNNGELKPDLPLNNSRRFSFSMVANKLGEIVWVYVPLGMNEPFKIYPVIEPIGNGQYGVLFGKRSSSFEAFDWLGRRLFFLDIEKFENASPIHHDFIAYNGKSFVTFSYNGHNFGTNKTYVTSTLVRTHIQDKKIEVLKDFGEDFHPQKVEWKEENLNKKYFWNWKKPDAEHDFTHANGLVSTRWGHLVSFRHLSRIVLLEKKTLDIIWTAGSDKQNTYVAEGKAAFDYQHSPTLDKHKNLIIFDNGYEKRRSRVLALRLNKGKAHFLWEYPRNSKLFSKDRGSVIINPKENIVAYFVSPKINGREFSNMTRSDYIFEIDPDTQEQIAEMRITYFAKSPGYRAVPLQTINGDDPVDTNLKISFKKR